MVVGLEGGYLFGRGSADAKGSLAAMLTAFLATLHSPNRRACYVVASVDEEYGLCGCRKLTEHHMRPHLAITGEPTLLAPIYAQKGIVRSCIHLRGKPFHAAYPAAGNALFSAGRVLAAIQALNVEFEAGAASTCGLSSTTVTPVRIDSDGDMNKTASEVRVWFDARTLPGLSTDALLQRLRECAQAGAGSEVAVDIEAPYFESPPNLCSTADPLVVELFSKIESVMGYCEPSTFSYGSEAGVLSQIAQASLVLGPGDPKYSHGPGERIALKELAAASEIYARILVAARH